MFKNVYLYLVHDVADNKQSNKLKKYYFYFKQVNDVMICFYTKIEFYL